MDPLQPSRSDFSPSIGDLVALGYCEWVTICPSADRVHWRPDVRFAGIVVTYTCTTRGDSVFIQLYPQDTIHRARVCKSITYMHCCRCPKFPCYPCLLPLPLLNICILVLHHRVPINFGPGELLKDLHHSPHHIRIGEPCPVSSLQKQNKLCKRKRLKLNDCSTRP